MRLAASHVQQPALCNPSLTYNCNQLTLYRGSLDTYIPYGNSPHPPPQSLTPLPLLHLLQKFIQRELCQDDASHREIIPSNLPSTYLPTLFDNNTLIIIYVMSFNKNCYRLVDNYLKNIYIYVYLKLYCELRIG